MPPNGRGALKKNSVPTVNDRWTSPHLHTEYVDTSGSRFSCCAILALQSTTSATPCGIACLQRLLVLHFIEHILAANSLRIGFALR